MIQDPQTPTEWQEAVDLAEFFLLLDAARKYNLVTGGPDILLERCEQILREGRRQSIRPHQDCVERLIGAYLEANT